MRIVESQFECGFDCTFEWGEMVRTWGLDGGCAGSGAMRVGSWCETS